MFHRRSNRQSGEIKLVSSLTPEWLTWELYELTIITFVWSHSSKYKNTTKTIKIYSTRSEGMSSSLLGTIQTDWITGRSLETVFSFLRSRRELLPLQLRVSRKEWEGMEEIRQLKTTRFNTYTIVRGYGQGSSILSRSPHRSHTWTCSLKNCCSSQYKHLSGGQREIAREQISRLA